MPGSNAGTGWPLYFCCSKCRRGNHRSGWDVIRTGRTRPYNGGNQGVRGLRTFHEYQCRCGHVGWSRHVDIVRKPLLKETHTERADLAQRDPLPWAGSD